MTRRDFGVCNIFLQFLRRFWEMYTRRLLESSYDKYIPCTRKKQQQTKKLLDCLALKVIHARYLVSRTLERTHVGMNLCREKFGQHLLILAGTISFSKIVWVSTMIGFNDSRVLGNILTQVSPSLPGNLPTLIIHSREKSAWSVSKCW